MDALVMAGGRGSRLDADVEKPLLRISGRPMVDRVLDALHGAARVDAVRAATSPQAPETRAALADRPVEVVETPGEGYVADLDAAVARHGTPLLTVAADLPLLSAEVVDRVLGAHDRGSLTLCVPAALKDGLGLSRDRTLDREGDTGADRSLAPAGVNVVGGDATPDADEPGERLLVSWDARLAVNVNTRGDAAVAEGFL